MASSTNNPTVPVPESAFCVQSSGSPSGKLLQSSFKPPASAVPLIVSSSKELASDSVSTTTTTGYITPPCSSIEAYTQAVQGIGTDDIKQTDLVLQEDSSLQNKDSISQCEAKTRSNHPAKIDTTTKNDFLVNDPSDDDDSLPLTVLIAGTDDSAIVTSVLHSDTNSAEEGDYPNILTSMDVNGIIDSDHSDETSDKRKRREIKWQKKSNHKPKKTRIEPNSFVAVQISSPAIRDKLKLVQDSMVSHNCKLGKTLTSLKKLHITLTTIRLDTDEDIERGVASLHAASKLINFELKGKPLELQFTGLSSFGSRVVFANISTQSEQALQRIAEIVRKVFESNGLKNTDKRKSFTPHATIAKVRMARISIPREAYSSYMEDEFGTEVVKDIELLSMTKPASDDGYYYCFQRSRFS